jgi:hypothetical protein
MPNRKTTTDYDRWLSEAQALGAVTNPLKVPYVVALEEAGTAAAFLEARWEPKGEIPGLRSVKKRLPRSTADDLRSLVRATQDAQTRLLFIVDPVVVDRGERARFLVDELESALEFLLDDDDEEPADAQLAQLKEFHAQDGERSSALSQALRDYGNLAKSLRKRLVEDDEAFDEAWIDEALKLADQLAESPAPGEGTGAQAADATLVRNQMLTLLTQRVALVRRCAARVFRRQPEIVREVMSAFERRRRAAARRAKAAEAKKKADGKPTAIHAGQPIGE